MPERPRIFAQMAGSNCTAVDFAGGNDMRIGLQQQPTGPVTALSAKGTREAMSSLTLSTPG